MFDGFPKQYIFPLTRNLLLCVKWSEFRVDSWWIRMSNYFVPAKISLAAAAVLLVGWLIFFLVFDRLRRMWEVMLDCHKLQFHVISVAYTPTNIKISIQSDSRRQITMELENELNSLSYSFTKWIGAQKAYIEAINKWLYKCFLPQKSSKKKRRLLQPPPLRNYGPPIYVTCGVWLDKLDTLPTKAVTDSIKSLAAEVSHFLPRQEKNQGKHGTSGKDVEKGMNLLRNEGSEEQQQRPAAGLDQFRISLAGFLCQLSHFADFSVTMFTDLQKEIEKAKSSYQLLKSQEK